MQTFAHSSARWCALFNNGPLWAIAWCVCALNSRTREEKLNSLSCCSSSEDITSTHAIRTRFFFGREYQISCTIWYASFWRRVRERVNGLANFEHALLCTLLISMGMQIRRHVNSPAANGTPPLDDWWYNEGDFHTFSAPATWMCA